MHIDIAHVDEGINLLPFCHRGSNLPGCMFFDTLHVIIRVGNTEITAYENRASRIPELSCTPEECPIKCKLVLQRVDRPDTQREVDV